MIPSRDRILAVFAVLAASLLGLANSSTVPAQAPAKATSPGGDDVGKPAAPPQDDAFMETARQKMAVLDEMFGKDFFWYFTNDGVMPRPYMVAAERSKNVDTTTLEKEYSEIFGYLYQEFFREYGPLVGAKEITEPVVAIVFDSKESYEKLFKERKDLALADPEFMAGYFRPDNEMLYQWRQEDLWEVMFHEGTHQLVHHATKKWGPSALQTTPWFSEGIADYMGGHTRKTTFDKEKNKFVIEFKLGQYIQGRYSALQSDIERNVLSLKELCYLDFFKFKQAQNNQSGSSENQSITGAVYAEGWAFVKFLHEYDGGKYRAYFNQFFQAECQGKGGGDSFAKIMSLETDEDWADLEKEFRDWVYGDLRGQKPKKKGS